ncbi:ECF transporter S component [Brevibacillus laterosporus]|uniref:ECF transporter S component n=1 Tax=Brevibacillus laterosporus TaxID=1465 RepID=UPI00036BC79A|nr:ECF transporter S component [Brevibacillus laterosporus]ATO51811.1 ECF transporter S component [Brevibacillus laterosporus DSM 25]MBG9774834.1 metal ABC transporter permease [Brevibacillus laterosporus]MED2006172.1 ECF transporter S component [Brevibacillus laterosporus]
MLPNYQMQKAPLSSVKGITLLAILAALSVAGRIALSFIPNVQPVTTIVILMTILMGLRYGLLLAIIVMILSNMVLGIGIWTLPQIIAYCAIVVVTSIFMRPLFSKLSLFVMALYAGFTGLLYGFIISLCQIPLYGSTYFLAYYLAGIPFDTLHAIGNFVFYFVLAPLLLPLLHKLINQHFDKS